MIIKDLSGIPFDDFLECFLKSFENYFVKLPTDKSYYEQRWISAKIDARSSYGVFDSGMMVGFIIHGVDTRNGKLTAYNAGTGVIPEYRGRRIVKNIYDHTLNDFRSKGIKLSTLEVITKNDIAIHIYKDVGFEITRHYKCYNGMINIDASPYGKLVEVDMDKVNWNNLPGQDNYSWDNQWQTLVAGNYRFFEIWFNGVAESFFVINPEQKYLAQFDVIHSNDIAWRRLFSGIKQISEEIRVNNVDDRLSDKVSILSEIGLDNTIDQFEMEMDLT